MRWQTKAASLSGLMPDGVRRVYVAMVMMADWKGRLRASHADIAACACLSRRHVLRMIPLLIESGDVICSDLGTGRRANYYHLLPLRSGDT